MSPHIRQDRSRYRASTRRAVVTLAAGLIGCGPAPGAGSSRPLEPLTDSAAGGSAPEIQSLRLSPDQVDTEGLIAASVEVYDADGDAISLRYDWTVDGAAIDARGSLLDGRSWFEAGQVVSVSVTPSDGALTGGPAHAGPVRVVNSPPGAPRLGLPASPIAGVEDLVCAILESGVDLDGDPLSYRFQWWLDGAPFDGAADGSWPGDTVPAAAIAAYTTWRCRVTPSDGEGEGPAAEAEAIAALDYPGWTERAVSLEGADYTLLGARPYAQSGYAAAGAGDVDGDGRADLLIGAPDSDDGSEDGGAVALVTAAALLSGGAGWTLSSGVESSHAGTSAAGAGDVDGDGLADVLVGAPGSDGEAGSSGAYLVGGAGLAGAADGDALELAELGILLAGEAPEDRAGHAVAGAGDVDGDGLADVLVGAYWSSDTGHKAGRTYLITGASLAACGGADFALSDADFAWSGESASGWSGASVAGVGDVDGDGLDDALIGAPYDGEAAFGAGKSYLMLGAGMRGWRGLSSADYAFLGEGAEDNSGEVVAGAGDVDGDGRADLLIGARDSDRGGTSAGVTYVVTADRVEDGALSDAPALVGEGENDRSGVAAGVGDLDGDGLGEILVGASNRDSYRGGAYLVFGAALERGDGDLSLAEYVFTGESTGDFAGLSLAVAGDVDGDGRADLLIGAPGSARAGESAGVAYVILSP